MMHFSITMASDVCVEVYPINALFIAGISIASHLKGNLVVFFPGEISAVSLASVGTFCVARQNADPTALQTGLDWACGPGLANCGPIQPGQPCYVANNIAAIASYAYDAYYQANQATGGTCSFNNTAMLTNNDPSKSFLLASVLFHWQYKLSGNFVDFVN